MKRFMPSWAVGIGHFIEQYEKTLFTLLAPVLASLFFPEEDPILGLIWVYALIPLGRLARPLGAVFWGQIGDRWGRRCALSWSLLGTGAVVAAMSALPSFSAIGPLAQGLFIALRFSMGFISAGESTGGALLVLENTPQEKRSWASSLFDATGLLGTLFAMGGVALLGRVGALETGWRFLCGASALLALWGIALRRNMTEEGDVMSAKRSCVRLGVKEWKACAAIAAASGFGHVTYALVFLLMNGWIPLVSPVSAKELLYMSPVLLLLDLLLLPLMGRLAGRVGARSMMGIGAWGILTLAIPLFYLLEGASFGIVIGVQLCFLICGVAFAAPYHAWAMEQIPSELRYRVLAIGSSIGALLIGSPVCAVSLSLYRLSGWVIAPAFYLMGSAVFALLALFPGREAVGKWVRSSGRITVSKS